jgi:hypothetical protein
MKLRTLDEMLADATKVRRDIELQIEKMQAQREQLSLIIEQMMRLIALSNGERESDTVSGESGPSIAETARNAEPRLPSWLIARKLLQKAGEPLTVPQLHFLMKLEYGVSPSRDALRIAMLRKPEIFCNEGGRFDLVARIREFESQATESSGPELTLKSDEGDNANSSIKEEVAV